MSKPDGFKQSILVGIKFFFLSINRSLMKVKDLVLPEVHVLRSKEDEKKKEEVIANFSLSMSCVFVINSNSKPPKRFG